MLSRPLMRTDWLAKVLLITKTFSTSVKSIVCLETVRFSSMMAVISVHEV